MGLEKIIESKLEFYVRLTTGDKQSIKKQLQVQGISILQGFIDNLKLVKEFYEIYYNSNKERLVLCGINPGKMGAGKTGVPFLDFKSLATMFPLINKQDSELSSSFIMSIINYFGAREFFNKVYLTNLSWFGFSNGKSNVNYYNLSNELQFEFISGFMDEMKIVQPSVVVPLSKEVEKSLKFLMTIQPVKWHLAQRLPHPYYYSNFNTRVEEGKKKYIQIINNNHVTTSKTFSVI